MNPAAGGQNTPQDAEAGGVVSGGRDAENGAERLLRLEGENLRLRSALAAVPEAMATVRDVWENGQPAARGFLRHPDGGRWLELATALDTLAAFSAGRCGKDQQAYEQWVAANPSAETRVAELLAYLDRLAAVEDVPYPLTITHDAVRRLLTEDPEQCQDEKP